MRKALLLKRLTELFKVLQCNQGFFPPSPTMVLQLFCLSYRFCMVEKAKHKLFSKPAIKKKNNLERFAEVTPNAYNILKISSVKC